MSKFVQEIRREILPNGLRIIHCFDDTSAMAAVNVLYDTGSRDEARNSTGIAHLFEHLMFGGTKNGAGFDDILANAGGISNAWTSTDFTNFYDNLPVQNLETAFFLESNRMATPPFDKNTLMIQQGVVIEEFKQTCLDVPYGDCFHRLRKLSYSPEHPYSWPTIGLIPEHIKQVKISEAFQWHTEHYEPSRAILAVTGNVSFDETVRLALKWFGDIPARVKPSRTLPSPGFPQTDIVEFADKPVPVPMQFIAIPMSAYGEKSYFAADAVTDLLAAGRSARFRSLIYGEGKNLISEAEASVLGCEHEGLLLITARLNDNSERAFNESSDILLSAARKLAVADNIAEYELERCFNTFESNFRFSNNSCLSKAQSLAMAEYHGEDFNATVDKRRELSGQDIAATADKLFNNTPFVTLNYGAK